MKKHIEIIERMMFALANYTVDGKGVFPALKAAKEALVNQTAGVVHIDDVFKLIAGHSNYQGDDILTALMCVAEGKDIKSVKPLPCEFVEVVRCRNCKHAYFRYAMNDTLQEIYACRKRPAGRAHKKVSGDFFCKHGERRDT